MSKQRKHDYSKPAPGWSTDSRGWPTWTSHEVFARAPQAPPGHEVYWIARHTGYVIYTYRPTEEAR